jgi:CRISPR system Cascade subunit CasE
MHLTRLEINPRRHSVTPLLASPQRLHAAVLAAFPESREEPPDGRILWRLDEGSHDHVLYIVSPGQPDLTHLVETAGRPTHGWQTRDYDPFLNRLQPGQQWAFRLRANPVHNARPADGVSRGKRFAHVTAAQQTSWFRRRAEVNGFSVANGAAGEPNMLLRARHTVKFDRRGQTVTLTTAVFEGVLRVEDATALRAALTNGIGPAKGYGCGLLTLAAP